MSQIAYNQTFSLRPEIRVHNNLRQKLVHEAVQDDTFKPASGHSASTDLMTQGSVQQAEQQKAAPTPKENKNNGLKQKAEEVKSKLASVASDAAKTISNLSKLSQSKLSPELRAALELVTEVVGGLANFCKGAIFDLAKGVKSFVKALPGLGKKLAAMGSRIKSSMGKLGSLLNKAKSSGGIAGRVGGFLAKTGRWASVAFKGLGRAIPVADTALYGYDTYKYGKKSAEAGRTGDQPRKIIFGAMSTLTAGLTVISAVSSLALLVPGGQPFGATAKVVMGLTGGSLGLVEHALG